MYCNFLDRISCCFFTISVAVTSVTISKESTWRTTVATSVESVRLKKEKKPIEMKFARDDTRQEEEKIDSYFEKLQEVFYSIFH